MYASLTSFNFRYTRFARRGNKPREHLDTETVNFQSRGFDYLNGNFPFDSNSVPSIPICYRAMSFQATVSKLHAPVKQLVLSATKDGKELVGETTADEKEVIGWIEKTSQGNLVTENNLKVLDSPFHLTSMF